ncbi:MAG: 3-hydroxyacyl-CoA dehydrogenase family protein [Planctomycetes bacterium]|jgi:3-hydroxybutyryl-CoA dehydrogenase|nr:3-hydroxyacyl-CoA dehydrogenase family protein [Planctomycetota bacterium]
MTNTIPNTFSTVAVLGAGTMGAGIAQVCAQAGSSVVLQDITAEFVQKGLERIRDFLQKGVDKGKTTAEQRDAVLARITTTTDRAGACRQARLVIEAVPEKLELKNGLFRELSAVVSPDCVLASNTSSLSLAKVFAGVQGPARCIGMHFFNPVPLMALLELVRTAATGQATIDAVTAYARLLGKEPILVVDSPGFASSRLGVCLGLEAIRMFESGVASAEDIDKAMVLGYGHPMGPLKLTDLVGLDVRLAIADYLRKELDHPGFQAPELMRRMVAEGKLGKKSGQGFYRW